ncbi:17446_t:CDS:2 [Racocetra persica]|uniref:17446_t:CDS:1 n=1 Tax=Racocetra persica TaxID=160502 RepID=A0ACA9KNE7_9GLOM|nr:17446_t:CDS:2 [Racocetra persica]
MSDAENIIIEYTEVGLVKSRKISEGHLITQVMVLARAHGQNST